ncbi:MAG: AAA family ATPase, partial [Muribaculaceae bacterium]|nr:AAA family ATPase [Muribaculaceae bacterium]
MDETLKYPIGEQDFESLREMGCVYIDKTKYIKNLVSDGRKYFFLARPRRFGKSLFLSTLRYFFEGKRELFRGLFI